MKRLLSLMLFLFLVSGAASAGSVRYTVDHHQLQKLNEDIRAWIYQEDSWLDEPVLQTKNNDFYRVHLFNHSADKRKGSVFLDTKNKADFSDRVNILYGRDRRDGTLFAQLRLFLDEDWAAEHTSFVLLAPEEDYEVRVFAAEKGILPEAPPVFEDDEAFLRYAEEVKRRAVLQADEKLTGEDRLLVLASFDIDPEAESVLIYGVMKPITYTGTENVVSLPERMFGEENTISRMLDIPGRGKVMYYAQNDPVWEKMRYEQPGSEKKRTFGGSGCAPTALAIAISAAAKEEALLPLLTADGKGTGFTFCTCSVNAYYCNHRHAQFRAQTAHDLQRFLPVLLGNYFTGNNAGFRRARNDGAGSTSACFPQIAAMCGLSFELVKSVDEALAAIDRGGAAIFCTGGADNLFSRGGHYLVLVSYDEDYFYILDPLCRESYSELDKTGVLKVLEPGLVRAARKDQDKLLMYTFYTMTAE